ncbi:hypothetical protein F5883DRAFT_238396 [Diaporthe sp. PMI_573]|nr:hypothetical protein F5883DRAFT_238396 [Diaporthaceae sp. PMI_573]
MSAVTSTREVAESTAEAFSPTTVFTTLSTESVTTTFKITLAPSGGTPIVETIIITSIRTLTPLEHTSIDQSANSTAASTQPPSSTHTSTSATTPLSTGSIAGIAIGSIAGAILLVLCLLFALGFRIRRAKWRRHGTANEAPEPRDEYTAAVATSGSPYDKAELPDAEYIRRQERLHAGAKPELDGSTARRLVRRLLSIGSLSRRGTRHAPAELGTEPPASGPHELPGDGISQTRGEEPRGEEPQDTRNAT